MTTAQDPLAAREVSAHFRAYRLCAQAEPHAEHVPCRRHVEEAHRQLADVSQALSRLGP